MGSDNAAAPAGEPIIYDIGPVPRNFNAV